MSNQQNIGAFDETALAIARNRLLHTGLTDFGDVTVRIHQNREMGGYCIDVVKNGSKDRLGGGFSWGEACDVALEELRVRFAGTDATNGQNPDSWKDNRDALTNSYRRLLPLARRWPGTLGARTPLQTLERELNSTQLQRNSLFNRLSTMQNDPTIQFNQRNNNN